MVPSDKGLGVNEIADHELLVVDCPDRPTELLPTLGLLPKVLNGDPSGPATLHYLSLGFQVGTIDVIVAYRLIPPSTL